MSDKPYHVLITRLSAIGDCVLTLPLASAIKQALPSARVSWCVSCAAKQLIDICPDVDNVIQVSKRWMKEPREWRRLMSVFGDSTIDCVLDPQSLTKSALLGRLSRAPMRVGFMKPQGRELAPFLNTVNIDGGNQHLCDQQLSLLRPLGIEPGKGQFLLNVPSDAKQWAANTIRSLTGHESPVIINPGAGWDSRLWPTDRFGEIAAWLKRNHGLPTLVVWAGDRERQFAREICSTSSGAAMLAPDTNLVQLAAILSQADTFLSSDTGPMHIAAAMGTRCVSLHGPTNPLQSGPYGQQHLSIRKVEFDGSSRKRRSADNWSMKEIEVADVRSLMDEMLARPQSKTLAA